MTKLDAVCFAVSVDTAPANARFAAALGPDSSVVILSDPTKTVARAYGVLAPSGYASRWTFYIGRDGRIEAIDKNVRASTHGEDVVTRLSQQRGIGNPQSAIRNPQSAIRN